MGLFFIWICVNWILVNSCKVWFFPMITIWKRPLQFGDFAWTTGPVTEVQSPVGVSGFPYIHSSAESCGRISLCMHLDCVPHVSPLRFSLVWNTLMALLFTVVLSVFPSRISRSHNPLFIPTEAQSVCKWTWVMADRERLTGPPIQASHAATYKHRKTHSGTYTQTPAHAQ